MWSVVTFQGALMDDFYILAPDDCKLIYVNNQQKNNTPIISTCSLQKAGKELKMNSDKKLLCVKLGDSNLVLAQITYMEK